MKKLLSIAFAVSLLGASSAWAQFTADMKTDANKAKNEIAKQKRENKTADEIAAAANVAGIPVDAVMSGLIAAGFDAKASIAACMKARYSENAVVNAAVATQAINLADAQNAAANARPAAGTGTGTGTVGQIGTPGSTGGQGTGAGGGKPS